MKTYLKYLPVNDKIQVGDLVYYYDLTGWTEFNPYTVLSINKSTGYIRTTANLKWLDYDSPPGRYKKILPFVYSLDFKPGDKYWYGYFEPCTFVVGFGIYEKPLTFGDAAIALKIEEEIAHIV